MIYVVMHTVQNMADLLELNIFHLALFQLSIVLVIKELKYVLRLDMQPLNIVHQKKLYS